MRQWILATALFAVAGCAVAHEGADQDQSAESTAEITSSAWQHLVGSYTPSGDANPYAAIVFESAPDGAGHHYFLEEGPELVSCSVGTGCVTSHKREEGWYSASSTKVTLHPTSGAAHRYSYKVSSTQLVLADYDTEETFDKVGNYCDTAADCGAEGLIHPMCFSGPDSGWQCKTDHTCAWSCGTSGGHGVGTTCGGIAAIQCDAGLTCNITDNSHPDATGTCVQVAKYGEHCGGNIATAPVCADGLVCELVPPGDKGGTCKVDVGGSCGGFNAGANQCASWLTCKYDSTTPDKPGICQ